MDLKEYLRSERLDVLSRMADLPHYIEENSEVFRSIGINNFREIYGNALRLNDDIDIVKRVVEHNKKKDRIEAL